MSEVNPYQPPRSQVADVGAVPDLGVYVEGGRAVEAGRGWAWIASAFGLFKLRAAVWIIITVILGVIVIVLSVLPFIGMFVTTLLMPVFAGGILLGCRALEGGGDIGVGQLFAGFSHQTGRLITLGILNICAWIVVMIPLVLVMGGAFLAAMRGDPTAIAAAGAGAAIGVLVVLALSIPVYMALWFAPALIVFHEAAPVQALTLSFRACLKNILPFLVYGVVMLVLAVIAAIPFGLGFLVLLPVLMASIYTSYRDIFFAAS